MDPRLLFNLMSVAAILAGWVLFVILWIQFKKEERKSHSSYRTRQDTSNVVPTETIVSELPALYGKDLEVMSESHTPTVTIRVSGRLFEGHLPYLNQLVQSAIDCRLWAVLDLAMLGEADSAAVRYLARGEGREFEIASCPGFVREWMERERSIDAA